MSVNLPEARKPGQSFSRKFSLRSRTFSSEMTCVHSSPLARSGLDAAPCRWGSTLGLKHIQWLHGVRLVRCQNYTCWTVGTSKGTAPLATILAVSLKTKHVTAVLTRDCTLGHVSPRNGKLKSRAHLCPRAHSSVSGHVREWSSPRRPSQETAQQASVPSMPWDASAMQSDGAVMQEQPGWTSS